MFGRSRKLSASKKSKARACRNIGSGFENLETRDLMATMPGLQSLFAVEPASATAAQVGTPQTADGNDVRSGALSMGTFSGAASSTTKSGSVGSSGDNQDYYKFVLTQSNSAKITLSGLSADLDFELQNSSGTRIGSAHTNSGTSSESGGYFLSGGTYYIRIYKGISSAVSNYTLNLKLGDDSRANALSVGSFDGTTKSYTRSGNIASNDSQDYYKFTMTASNRLVFSLSGLSADLDIQILNSSGTVISSGTKSGTTSESQGVALNAGTYYARVFQGVSGASSNYSLKLSFGDDSLAAANSLGTLSSGTTTKSGNVGGNDQFDYYKFTINSNLQTNVQLQLSGLSSDLDISLLSSSGSTITSSTKGSTSSESINRQLANGTYYVKVFKGTSTASSNYTLKFIVTQGIFN